MTSTLGPNFSRLVRAATAAIVVIGSGTTSGDDRRSENQTESTPVRSHWSMKRQSSSGPSVEVGHGPGITPMRYLIRMGAIVPRPPTTEFRRQGRAVVGTHK